MKEVERKCAYCGEEMKIHWAMNHPESTICEKCRKELVECHKENDELKECPFCGEKKFKYVLLAPYFYGAEGVKVRCDTCGAMGGLGGIRKTDWEREHPVSTFNAETIEEGFAKAKAKWNKRTPIKKDGAKK